MITTATTITTTAKRFGNKSRQWNLLLMGNTLHLNQERKNQKQSGMQATVPKWESYNGPVRLEFSTAHRSLVTDSQPRFAVFSVPRLAKL